MRVREITSALDNDVREVMNAYLEAAFWTDTIDEDGHVHAEDVYSFLDIAPDALDDVEADVRSFITANLPECTAWVRMFGWGQLGHDLWLTRNGHGTGFWDRRYASRLGERLTAMCKPMGESSLYVGDDGRVWFS